MLIIKLLFLFYYFINQLYVTIILVALFLNKLVALQQSIHIPYYNLIQYYLVQKVINHKIFIIKILDFQVHLSFHHHTINWVLEDYYFLNNKLLYNVFHMFHNNKCLDQINNIFQEIILIPPIIVLHENIPFNYLNITIYLVHPYINFLL